MLVTVAIPFYNPGIEFIHSIHSVLLQTYSNLEILLVNDGSTDGSLELAESINDPRVKVINDGINKGLNYRLNQIIDLASGVYLARMDADDLMALNRIEIQVRFLNDNPRLELTTTGLCSIDKQYNVLGFRGPKENGIDNNLTLIALLFGYKCPIHASLLAKLSWCKRNKYSEKYKRIEDFNLWLTAFKNNDLRIGFIKEHLYFYEESNSLDPKLLEISYKNQMKLLLSDFNSDFPVYTKAKFIVRSYLKIILIKLPLLHKYILNLRHQQNKEYLNEAIKVKKHIETILDSNKSSV